MFFELAMNKLWRVVNSEDRNFLLGEGFSEGFKLDEVVRCVVSRFHERNKDVTRMATYE